MYYLAFIEVDAFIEVGDPGLLLAYAQKTPFSQNTVLWTRTWKCSPKTDKAG